MSVYMLIVNFFSHILGCALQTTEVCITIFDWRTSALKWSHSTGKGAQMPEGLT